MKAKSNVSDPDSGGIGWFGVDVQLNEHETLDLGFDLEPEIVSEIEKETDTDIWQINCWHGHGGRNWKWFA